MIFWNINKLESKLVNREISEEDSVHYLILNLFLWSIAMYTGVGSEFSWIAVPEGVICVCILVYACKVCFKINSSGDNVDFFQRFFSLYWVLTMRLTAYIIFIIIPIALLIGFLFFNGNIFDVEYEWIDSLFTIVVTAIFYIRLIESFKRINKNTSSNIG